MLIFDAPSLPSPLTIREYARPRFDGSLDKLSDWLTALRSAGIRHSGPALILALEHLRRAELSSNRRLSVLSALKIPLLKTCAGLPKPDFADAQPLPIPGGVTLEQRLYRLMFINLNQTLRQLDRQSNPGSERHERQREWAIRNLFRFASRQLHYAARWKTRLPLETWRDLHALHIDLMTQRLSSTAASRRSATGASWTDPELEYKQLLLFGLAAQLNESVVNTDSFLEGLAGWATQALLEDPQRMLGRIRLFLVAISEDEPPRQQAAPLDSTFRGWVLQAPYSFVHRLENSEYTIASPRNSCGSNDCRVRPSRTFHPQGDRLSSARTGRITSNVL